MGASHHRGQTPFPNTHHAPRHVSIMLNSFTKSLLHSVALVLCSTIVSQAVEVQTIDFEPVDAARKRTVPVRVYISDNAKDCPVVLFSHGLGGARENGPYLGRYWAENGYCCVFMQHAGSDRDVWTKSAAGERKSKLLTAANFQNLKLRIQDVSFVIDQLEAWEQDATHKLHGKLNLKQIGLCGHSFGAVTTVACTGRQFPLGMNFKEPRIKAFFAMSPQTSDGISPDKAFGSIQAPFLAMTGTKDTSIVDSRLTPESRREVYEHMPPGDKYQLVFEDGTHRDFGEVPGGLRMVRQDSRFHPLIQKVSLQFWNAYLKDDKQAKKWLQSTEVKNENGMQVGDLWQWK